MKTLMRFTAVLAVLLAALPAVAQENRYRRLIRFQLKPGMQAEFEAAVKADKEAMTKAGYKRAQTWWLSTTGNLEVVLARYYSSYADMETAEKADVAVSLARNRVRHCVDGMETVIDEVIPEATTVTPSTVRPKYIRVLRATVKPDQLAEFARIVREDLGPAVKKAQLPVYVATQVRYGTTQNQFMTIVGMDSLAQFDSPLPVEAAMGKTAYAALMAKYATMVTHTETVIYRGMPDLNYLPQQ